MEDQREPPPLPDISTYTISQLKDLGTARGYTYYGTEHDRDSYVTWLTNMYQIELYRYNELRLIDAAVTNIICEADRRNAMLLDINEKLASCSSVIANLQNKPDKNIEDYVNIITIYEVIIKLKDIKFNLLCKK
jgi:hypothetical protein